MVLAVMLEWPQYDNGIVSRGASFEHHALLWTWLENSLTSNFLAVLNVWYVDNSSMEWIQFFTFSLSTLCSALYTLYLCFSAKHPYMHTYKFKGLQLTIHSECAIRPKYTLLTLRRNYRGKPWFILTISISNNRNKSNDLCRARQSSICNWQWHSRHFTFLRWYYDSIES